MSATHAGRRAASSILRRRAARSQAVRRSFATVVEPEQKDPVELDQVTALPNGIRVATEALPGHFSGIGVYVEAGSRYEKQSLSGVSHIIDRLAFKSTSSRSSDEMLEAVESLGGNVQCASSRESLMYQCATFNSSVQDAVALLAETIREPRITEEEVQDQLKTAEYEIGEIWSKPELILPEVSHMAAYKDNTLGNPLLCPKERLTEINKGVVDSYRSIFYRPDRVVVAFAGVSHDRAVKLAERHFGDMRPIDSLASQAEKESAPLESLTDARDGHRSAVSSSGSALNPSTPPTSKFLSKIPFIKNISTSAPRSASVLPSSAMMLPTPEELSAPARYTGGFMALDPLPPPPNPSLPRLSHIHLSFEGLPISSDDIYALATLQTLLGGGGSFSAGGPGKGMYSRLYTNVLNRYGWVESCMSVNQSYADSGLFGIAASCQPSKVLEMLEIMCRELYALTLDSTPSRLQQEEVDRAKNALRSTLLMNLESRMVELEDLGRQVQLQGRKVGAFEMCRKIEALTVDDLRRVARQIVRGEVTNVGKGTGRPTVVLQESVEEGAKRRTLTWPDLDARIARWQLGRR